MWTYDQSTGRLISREGERIGEGYSGAPTARNNPTKENVHNVGPIPRGTYEIGKPVDTVTHGPFVLRLSPIQDNEMYGRDGFLIHGDSVVEPGTASTGCIILPREVRETIWMSGDRWLEVV